MFEMIQPIFSPESPKLTVRELSGNEGSFEEGRDDTESHNDFEAALGAAPETADGENRVRPITQHSVS